MNIDGVNTLACLCELPSSIGDKAAVCLSRLHELAEMVIGFYAR